jgi:hypothetical protein
LKQTDVSDVCAASIVRAIHINYINVHWWSIREIIYVTLLVKLLIVSATIFGDICRLVQTQMRGRVPEVLNVVHSQPTAVALYM